MQSYFKIHWWMTDLWTGQEKDPVLITVNLWPPSVNLTLKLGVWVFRMTHRLIMVNICAKLFQSPLMDDRIMDRTRKRPCSYNSWPLTSKCDLDLEARGLGFSHDTSSDNGEHLCQVISKSIDGWQSYGPDTKKNLLL